MNVNEIYDEDYYMNGIATGKSNYENYRWLPELTLPMAANIKRYLGIKDGEKVLDFGCARGFVVKALRMLNVDAYGYDISKWPIENCDPEVKDFVSNEINSDPMTYDYVIIKDVLEHIPVGELEAIIPKLIRSTKKCIFITVPLTDESGRYICPRDEEDPSHVIRWTLPAWINFLQDLDRRMVVTGSYYVPEIKQANSAYENSCGLLKIQRF